MGISDQTHAGEVGAWLAGLSDEERRFFGEEEKAVHEATIPMKAEEYKFSPPAFTTKDSGKRVDLANGMVRDVETDKSDWTLILDGPMLKRWVELLSRGAKKYGARNWTKALEATPGEAREETIARFKRSAMRHFFQWLNGETDEDHAAAVFFNINGLEAMKEATRG